MSSPDIAHPFAIHLGVDSVLSTALEEAAATRGMSVIHLDISGLSDRDALVVYLARTFIFPHEARGLDSAIDLISDLEWLGNAQGYLVVARGLNGESDVAQELVSILPNIIDRWRSQSIPFVVAIDGKGDRLQSVLHSANRDMGRAGSLPWAQPGTGAVDVFVHGSERPEDAV